MKFNINSSSGSRADACEQTDRWMDVRTDALTS